jgi:TonB family protein
MKTRILTLLLLFVFTTGFAQKPEYEYTGRLTPSVKKEKLNTLQFVAEITPGFWRSLYMPYTDRVELDKRGKTEGYFNYNTVINYISVEISATCHGRIVTFLSAVDKLTPEQKNILSTADLGSDINIRVKFKYRIPAGDNPDDRKRVVEGSLAVAVVPETEAEYPGGFKQLNAYLKEHIFDKVSGAEASQKLQQAIVKFTVNEEGLVVDAKISRTSTDPQIDRSILEAIAKMPEWKPAKNTKGIKVKQEFTIPFGVDGC